MAAVYPATNSIQHLSRPSTRSFLHRSVPETAAAMRARQEIVATQPASNDERYSVMVSLVIEKVRQRLEALGDFGSITIISGIRSMQFDIVPGKRLATIRPTRPGGS